MPTRVVTDDYLPFRGTPDRFSFVYSSVSDTGATWGALAEKMWAKLSNNYEYTIAGNHEEIYPLFTGAPTTSHRCSSMSEGDLWDLLRSNDDADHIIGAGTPSPPDGQGGD